MVFFNSKKLVASALLCTMLAGSPILSAQSTLSNDEIAKIKQEVQLAKDNNYIVPNDIIDEAGMPNAFSTFGIDPGEGATRVNLVTYGYLGELVQQGNKSGTFNVIKETSINVLGSLITTTVGAVVLAALDITLNNMDVTKVATAKTLISYSYPTKEGQVWYSNKWFTHFESENRNTYKHYYAQGWDINKQIRQDTKDYTTINGYSAIRVENAPHYTNNTFIQEEAYRNYLQAKKVTSEAWFN